jgi:hypothetical protein
MSYIVPTENLAIAMSPVSLARAKNYLRLDSGYTADDEHITGLIFAAIEHIEKVTGMALAQRTFRQVMDSFPYYTDTIQSQLAYPPSYYSLPRYSTTLWNYSQMIKLFNPPVISVQQIRYIDENGNPQTMSQDVDFVLDRITRPARIFPIPGSYWPPNYYTPNSCEVDYTAGFEPSVTAAPDDHDISDEISPDDQQPDSIVPVACPHTFVRLILASVNHWYDNRTDSLSDRLESAIQAEAIIDFQPTRG